MAVKLEAVFSHFLLQQSLSEGAAGEAGMRTEADAEDPGAMGGFVLCFLRPGIFLAWISQLSF